MIAIDTNVVVRFITRDDAEQTPRAIECVAQGVYVSNTVLIETEWVLRGSFGWRPRDINRALRAFVSLEQVHVSNAQDLSWALDRHAGGADFADMLHLLSAREFSGFASFEKRLAQRAGLNPPTKVILL